MFLSGTPHPGIQALLLTFGRIGQPAVVEADKLVWTFVPAMAFLTVRTKIQYLNKFFTDIDRVLQVP